jgi:threonine dehydratase
VSLIGSRNITEFNYRYNDQRDAHVFVGIQVASRAESMRCSNSCTNTIIRPSI